MSHGDLTRTTYTPLTEAMIDDIKRGQRELHDLLPLIDSAEACGIECHQHRELHNFLSERLAALLKHFG